MTREQFVIKHAYDARYITSGTGIFPETLLAQAIVESQGPVAGGAYEPGASELAKVYQNYFGIKAHNWPGKTVTMDTGEYIGGKYVVIKDKFRVYGNFNESARDYIKFLKTNSRYAKVFKAPTYQAQIQALKDAGYATGPSYVSLVTGVADQVHNILKLVPLTSMQKIKIGTKPYVPAAMIGLGIGLITWAYLRFRR